MNLFWLFTLNLHLFDSITTTFLMIQKAQGDEKSTCICNENLLLPFFLKTRLLILSAIIQIEEYIYSKSVDTLQN